MTSRALALALLAALFAGCTSAAPGPRAATPTVRVQAQTEFDTANSFVVRGDFVRAEQYFVSALRHGYPETQVIVKLLRVCLGASRLRAALGYAQVYLLSHPNAWALRYLAATILVALEQPAAARREIERTLQSKPEHPGALRLMADLQSRSATVQLPERLEASP